jgi:hypothetical protein
MPVVSDENVFVAYVDGCDLQEIAPRLRAAFQQLIEGRQWRTRQLVFVDDRLELEESLKPVDGEDEEGWYPRRPA